MKIQKITCILFGIIPALFSQEFNLEIIPDIIYHRKAGMTLTYDMIQPQNPNGAAIIFINSGGFVSGKIRYIKKNNLNQYHYLQKDELEIIPENFKYPPLAQYSIDELLENGFTVFDVRHSSSPWFRLNEIVSDCQIAVAHIIDNASAYHINPENIGLFGGSAGGYLALYIGLTDSRVKAISVYYPAGYDFIKLKNKFSDVYSNLPALHIEDSLLVKLSLKNQISQTAPFCFFVYGEKDFPFILEGCRQTITDMKQKSIHLKELIIPNVGHEFCNEQGYQKEAGEQARKSIVQWFIKTLTSPIPGS